MPTVRKRAARSMGTIFVGFAYGSWGQSLYSRPPGTTAAPSIVDRVANNTFWAGLFFIAALSLMILPLIRSQLGRWGHGIAMSVVATYGVGNLLTSISNSTGWTIASAAGALTVVHYVSIKRGNPW